MRSIKVLLQLILDNYIKPCETLVRVYSFFPDGYNSKPFEVNGICQLVYRLHACVIINHREAVKISQFLEANEPASMYDSKGLLQFNAYWWPKKDSKPRITWLTETIAKLD